MRSGFRHTHTHTHTHTCVCATLYVERFFTVTPVQRTVKSLGTNYRSASEKTSAPGDFGMMVQCVFIALSNYQRIDSLCMMVQCVFIALSNYQILDSLCSRNSP